MFNGRDWVKSRFPESLYPSVSPDYFDRVADGIDIMRSKRVLICGICRDIEHNVQNIMSKLYRLGSMFRSYDIFIYENDSEDKTLSKIVESSARLNMPVTIENEKLNLKPHRQDKSEYRREIMAYARNKYLDFIKKYTHDYVIVCDLDIKVGWSYEGIANSFSFGLDAVGSNGIIYQRDDIGQLRKMFYDTWAFRPVVEQEEKNYNLLEFKRGEPILEVESCFGGLCIYKRDCITDSMRYTKDDCDHVTLHTQMRQDGRKIYINPSQIVVYDME